jgi:hypothetical protein
MKKLLLPLLFLFALISLSGTTKTENPNAECGLSLSMENLSSYGVSKVVIAGNGWSYTYNNPTFPIVVPGWQNSGWATVTVHFASSGVTGSVYVYHNSTSTVIACDEFDNHFITLDFLGGCGVHYTIYISEDPC